VSAHWYNPPKLSDVTLALILTWYNKNVHVTIGHATAVAIVTNTAATHGSARDNLMRGNVLG